MTKARLAQLLQIPENEVDARLLFRAEGCVRRKDTVYYDALANVGQIPGNASHNCEVAFVYSWLSEG